MSEPFIAERKPIEVYEFTSLEKDDILDLIDFVGYQDRGDVLPEIDKDELVSVVQSKGIY